MQTAWVCLDMGVRTQVEPRELLHVRHDFAFTRFDDIVVMCHSETSPPDQSWDTWVDWQSSNHYRAALISSRGGGPTPRQRRQLAERLEQIGMPPKQIALLCTSHLLRGILTAISWVTGASVKAFGPNDLAEALHWLNMSERTEAVKHTIAAMYAAMDTDL